MGADFKNNSWYCKECFLDPLADSFPSEWHVKKHLVEQHGLDNKDLMDGAQYCNGWMARREHARQEAEAEATSRRFGRSHFGREHGMPFTVEDFLKECGQ